MKPEKNQEKIFVAGHRGLVGSSIIRQLLAEGVLQSSIVTRTRAELDLCNQKAVQDFFSKEKLTQVYLAAAKVGGIHANNTYPAEFIYQNLMIQSNVIDAAHRSGVNKLLVLGSSCIYPQLAPQPMIEDALLTGRLEPTNEPYAIAKIAGIKLCESYNRQYQRDYRSAMPTSIYGPGDNYHPENSHVIPALLRRFHEAKMDGKSQVKIWGTGTAKREFLYVDDLAAAATFLMQLPLATYRKNISPMQSHINVGSGEEISIAALSEKISQCVGYTGEIQFDTNYPDGTPRKCLDSSLLNSLGWHPSVAFDIGLANVYADMLKAKINI